MNYELLTNAFRRIEILGAVVVLVPYGPNWCDKWDRKLYIGMPWSNKSGESGGYMKSGERAHHVLSLPNKFRIAVRTFE